VLLDGGNVLVAGGKDEGGAVSDALLFTGDGFRNAGQTTGTYMDHAVARVTGGALVAGGGRSVELYDGSQFVPAGELAVTRRHLTLTSLPDGRAVAIGGQDGANAQADVEIFRP
jgi:hypothetical protein